MSATGPAAWCWRLALAATGVAMVGGCEAGPGPQAAQAERGRVLMARYHCGSCHTIPGVAAAQGKLAASLEAYGRRHYIVGRVANQPATLARWIADPAALVPGTLMPNMGVAPAEASDMAVYLGRLR